jgi:hypothetical protein
METKTPTSTAGVKRRLFTEPERRAHLLAWKRSGRSAREYAAEHGLRAANLYAWSKKHGTAGPARVEDCSFVPVRIASGGFIGRGLRVTLKGRNFECMIEGTDAPEAIAVLAGALKREVFDV